MPAVEDLRELLEKQRLALERSEPGVLDGTDPEELHRLRVATRRSRALIRASRPILRDQLAALDRELRWLGTVTSEVRDLDVLIEHVRRLTPSLDPDQDGAEEIVAALERERERERDLLVAAIETPRFRELMQRFAQSVPGLQASDGNASLTQLARKELGRLRTAYEQLDLEVSNDEALHEVRIRAKHARYAAEFAAATAGPRLEFLADALAGVQDLIGSHQDAVVAERRVREVATDEVRLAAGRVIEHERQLRREARAALPGAMDRVERRAERAL